MFKGLTWLDVACHGSWLAQCAVTGSKILCVCTGSNRTMYISCDNNVYTWLVRLQGTAMVFGYSFRLWGLRLDYAGILSRRGLAVVFCWFSVAWRFWVEIMLLLPKNQSPAST